MMEQPTITEDIIPSIPSEDETQGEAALTSPQAGAAEQAEVSPPLSTTSTVPQEQPAGKKS